MKACLYGAVAGTIARICPDVAGKIKIRRKYKTNNSGRTTRWWFIIRGEEETLTKLEEGWEGIFNQTAWKLEHCYISKEGLTEETQTATLNSPRAEQENCPKSSQSDQNTPATPPPTSSSPNSHSMSQPTHTPYPSPSTFLGQ